LYDKSPVYLREESPPESFGRGDFCWDGWGVEVSSAGVGAEAVCPVSADLLEWADKVFVMEQSQKKYLNAHFARSLKDKKIVCLNIPDRYGYMQPELVAVLRAKVLPLLRRSKGL
jgi:predicted protein tyrosine phosphatase